ncbi:hypothetical protein DFH06DRAFT_730499 [Mycena polygramma]|nr:hypothetical protein DFH06DRAFT_730499 [Mycena polygramma]
MQAFSVTVKSIHRGIQVGVPFILLCVCAVVPLFIPTVRSLLEYGEETAPLTFFGISMVALLVALAAAFHSAGSDVYNKKVEPAALSALLGCFVWQFWRLYYNPDLQVIVSPTLYCFATMFVQPLWNFLLRDAIRQPSRAVCSKELHWLAVLGLLGDSRKAAGPQVDRKAVESRKGDELV